MTNDFPNLFKEGNKNSEISKKNEKKKFKKKIPNFFFNFFHASSGIYQTRMNAGYLKI